MDKQTWLAKNAQSSFISKFFSRFLVDFDNAQRQNIGEKQWDEADGTDPILVVYWLMKVFFFLL